MLQFDCNFGHVSNPPLDPPPNKTFRVREWRIMVGDQIRILRLQRFRSQDYLATVAKAFLVHTVSRHLQKRVPRGRYLTYHQYELVSTRCEMAC